MKIERNADGEEVCEQCKQLFKGAKYLDKIKKLWVCVRCFFDQE